MAVATAVAIYFLIWWIVLFAVLPWGVRAQGDGSAPGTDPGAPQAPRLLVKLAWTTIVAGLVWAVGALFYLNNLVSIDGLAALLGFPTQKP